MRIYKFAIGSVLLLLAIEISAIALSFNPDKEAVEFLVSVTEPAANAAFSPLPNYYRYVYRTGDVSSITDGGNDMYDGGNVLRVWKDGDPRPVDSPVNYNTTFADNDGVFYGSSVAGNPFQLSTLIRNDNNSFYNIFIEESSDLGADGSGEINRFSGTVQNGQFRMDYEVYQVQGLGDASVVQVYYVISSPTVFGSSGTWSLSLQELSTSPLETTNNTARIIGTMNNVYFGYMLLSFFPNDLLQQSTFEIGIDQVLADIATQFLVVSSTTTNPFVSTQPPLTPASQVTRSLLALDALGDGVRNQIPDFYSYDYDGGNGSINDGGNDMYDGGNRVSFQRGSVSRNINYGETYSFPDFTFGSSAIHPFTALMWFDSSNANGDSVIIQVTSDSGADGSGTIEQLNGSVTGPYGNYTVKYEVFQLYDGDTLDPSIIEVYFTLESFEWNSSPTNLQLEIRSSDQNNLANLATLNPLNGVVSNVMFGYTLLSKNNGVYTPISEIENALLEMTRIIITYGLDPSIPIPGLPASTIIPPSSTVQSTVSSTQQPRPDEDAVEFLVSITEPAAEAAFSPFSNYYRYVYSTGDLSSITDGGNDMYDGGNVLRVWKGGDPRPVDSPVNYNTTFADIDGVFYGSSVAGNPFQLSTLIRNDNNNFYNIFIEESSDLGADGRGDITRYSGTVQNGQFRMDYEVYQVRGENDASVVQVYYVLSSPTVFGSSGTWSLSLQELSTSPLFTTNNTAQLSGTMNNVYFGYMLLSFFPNDLLLQSTFEIGIDQVLSNIATQFPVAPTTTNPFVSTQPPIMPATQVTRSLLALDVLGDGVRSQIPDFYSYDYDGGNGSINDGGNDMYDGGNMVLFQRGSVSRNINYGETYSFPEFTFGSSAIHPFTALMWFGSSNANGDPVIIQVTSNSGADGTGTIEHLNGSVTGPYGNYTVKYEVFQLYDGDTLDPSIIEVYFTLESFEWNSSPTNLQLEIRSFNQDDLLNRATLNPLSGVVSNVMFGYTLLSKNNGVYTPISEIENALLEMNRIIITYGLDPSIPIPGLPTSTFLPPSSTVQTTVPTVASTVSSTQQPRPDKEAVEFLVSITEPAVEAAFSPLPNYYRYVYSTGDVNSITDGGNDMYDGGNVLRVWKGGDPRPDDSPVNYNTTFADNDGVFYGSSVAGNPFQLSTLIRNDNNSFYNIFIEESSDLGADGRGNITRYSGTVQNGQLRMDYGVYQVQGPNDASVIQVYYVLSSPTVFGSSGNWFLSLQELSTSPLITTNNTARISGTMNNVYFGYMLLSFFPNDLLLQSTFEIGIDQVLADIATQFLVASSTTTNPFVSTQPPLTPASQVTRSLLALDALGDGVRNQILEFYSYDYDGGNGSINDGGNDMYDGGNRVLFQRGPVSRNILYGETYSFPDFTFGSSAIHPFTALMWFGSSNANGDSVIIQVTSDSGADGSGTIEQLNGSVTGPYGNYTVKYEVFQLYDGDFNDPSIIEVYFTLESFEWNSSPTNLQLEVRSSDQNNLVNLATLNPLSGVVSNVMFGYTLLSKNNGVYTPISEIENALLEMTRIIITYGLDPNIPIPGPPSSTIFPPSSTFSPSSTIQTPTAATTDSSTPQPRPVPSTDTFIGQVLSYLNDYSYDVRDGIPNFYYYEYDGVNEISDGGNDMYDGGNRVFFNSSFGNGTAGLYDQVTSGNGYQAGTHTGYPFNAIMWIEGGDESFSLGVTGNAGADNSGNITIFNGTVYYEDSVLYYHAFQISGAFDPTICEVYYQVVNPAWNSTGGYLKTSFSDNTENLANGITLSGYPVRQFLGYTLFSRPNGVLIQQSEIENALSFDLHVYSYHVSAPSSTTSPPSSSFSTFTPPFSTSSTPNVSRPPPAAVDTFVGQVLNYLHDYSYNVRDGISNFYYYEYDGVDEISDGGNDMYDGGNRVFFAGPYNTPTQAYYDQVSYGDGYQAGIHTGYPFNALMWVEGAGESYSLEVSGNTGADGSGNITTFNGTVYYDNSVLYYHVFQISGAGDPTICEVYYQVKNPAWNSTGGYIRTSFSETGTDQLSNVVTLVDYPRRQFLGYTLFSRPDGSFIPQQEIENALSFVLHVFAYHVKIPGPTSSPPFTTTSPFSTFSPPFSTSSPPFTTPTGSPPPPVTDVDFLPSCSLRETIRKVWSCESAFTSQAPYSDPNQCRSNINTVIHCVANQLTQCANGDGPNIFRRFNLPVDIEFFIKQIRYLASSGSSCYSYDPITAFCQKSSLPDYFFSPLGNMTSGIICQPLAVQGVIRNLTDFYYAYVGARTSGEICMAYRKLREGFVATLRYQCNLQSLRYYLDYYHPELFRYVQQAVQVTLDSAAVLEISSCPKIAVNNSRTRISTEWLKGYAKWRSGYLPRWQASYIRWVEELDSLYQPLPDVPACLDLTGITCRDPSQYSCEYDYYSCQFCYCLDHRYNGLTQAMLEPWTQDFKNWEHFMYLWDEAYNSWKMNDGVL